MCYRAGGIAMGRGGGSDPPLFFRTNFVMLSKLKRNWGEDNILMFSSVI
jgi:hypothetical protein